MAECLARHLQEVPRRDRSSPPKCGSSARMNGRHAASLVRRKYDMDRTASTSCAPRLPASNATTMYLATRSPALTNTANTRPRHRLLSPRQLPPQPQHQLPPQPQHQLPPQRRRLLQRPCRRLSQVRHGLSVLMKGRPAVSRERHKYVTDRMVPMPREPRPAQYCAATTYSETRSSA